jgi:hypothetical protein
MGRIETMRTLAKILIVIVLPLGLLVWLIVYDQQVKSGFPSIEPGMSTSEVRQAAGNPTDVFSPCGKWGGDPPAGCEREYSYPTLTGIWVVSFDANGKVISKTHLKL